ncbi:hypothetical protein GLOIN_2v1671693 [Rhizophagus irregularis DAOM 181602=DAOM 197198]|uniref:Uncharacterized protein n=1 Tax=Rhizophagus irregularis (strain DAOM 181602 / DAOM 197198 / MUCL 43194) TaxID=747089 RepID=A0A2P4PHD8_RHIID|nr:hypothetical protein GLOIN_2v1671693 [Rhizophagus irregularis DAOM 181602=DAOM 197198]POG64803.1 hypothetical protein GLOIN_2v1671693 [Rhizophagus irregularis DAOM 181602=DAOM 197198]|eukprot:XP_025171669.1 hypothetical protein GLOIN_2v1671693 [Rhizophagus irregularis DAOM 181602=DAOM 197198]
MMEFIPAVLYLNIVILQPYKKIGYVFYKVFIRFFSLEITYHNRIRKNAQFRITKNMVWIRNLHGIHMEFT